MCSCGQVTTTFCTFSLMRLHPRLLKGEPPWLVLVMVTKDWLLPRSVQLTPWSLREEVISGEAGAGRRVLKLRRSRLLQSFNEE
mmetsp:Transcript_40241/g.94277  ORF Transcript_40241/g.94277 Transcript_40241/m.94277 type:complete len:84 (+) Transcript_40241:1043-1294(+)